MSLIAALSRPRVHVVALVLALTVAFVGATTKPAHAAPGANQTVLTFDPMISIGLNVAKVELRPVGASRIGSAGVYYNVTRSNAANAQFAGVTRHQGGLEFVLGKTLRAGFVNPIVTLGKNGEGKLEAHPRLNGMLLPLALPIGRLTRASVSTRSGYVTATYRLRIEPIFSEMVNGALGIKLISPNQVLATLQTRIPAKS